MMQNADIGAMDTLVELQSCTITLNDKGAKVKTYTFFRKVWAKVDRNIDEQVAMGNLEAGQLIYLTIYKIAALDTRWRVMVDGTPFEIKTIDPIDRLSPLCRLTIQTIQR
jgi:head-tail adaptor